MDIEKARKDGWIEVWFAIEALGGSKEIVEDSLKEHIDKLSHEQNVLVTKKEFKPVDEVKNPPQPLKQAWSQITNITILAKDLQSLIRVVLLYGPSAIEVMAPKSKNVPAGEIQDIVNMLAGLMHQFVAAGIGGMVITPKNTR